MDILIKRAQRIVDEFGQESKMKPFFKHCHGIVLISSVEVGFVLSGNVGTGILMRHDMMNDKWSPPCAVEITGIGAGLYAGAEKKDICLFLTNRDMVKALTGTFQLRLGPHTSLTVGPLGKEFDFTLHMSSRGFVSTSSFAHTSGIGVGISLEGAALLPKSGVNREFYGEKVAPKKIVYGQVDTPEGSGVEQLHEKLQALAHDDSPLQLEYKDTIASPFLKKPYLNKIGTVSTKTQDV